MESKEESWSSSSSSDSSESEDDLFYYFQKKASLKNTRLSDESRTSAISFEEQRGAYDAAELLRVCSLYHLDTSEINALKRVFKKLDKNNSGTIDKVEMFEWLREPTNLLSNHLFNILELREIDALNLPEFIVTVSTYVLFGKDEIILFCFALFDWQKNGYIEKEDFFRKLELIHGGLETPYANLQLMIQNFEYSIYGRITFKAFVELTSKYPSLLFPAFRMQKSFQRKIMGSRWWNKKRRYLVSERKNNPPNQDEDFKVVMLSKATNFSSSMKNLLKSLRQSSLKK